MKFNRHTHAVLFCINCGSMGGMIRHWLKEKLGAQYPGVAFDIMTPPDSKMGDYSLNLAFALAKQEKKAPMIVAEEIVAQLSGEKMFSQVQAVAPGFVNLTLSQEFLCKQLGEIHKSGEVYGGQDLGKNKKVIIEYSAPNIAKPMHIGHLRSTIIGDALANIYAALGYNVTRWNYIGDWGTQFGKLIAAWKRWADQSAFDENPIPELLRLYVKFHDELKSNPDLEKEGQEEFKKLEEGDSGNRGLWAKFREKSLSEFNRMYDQLGIDSSKMIMKGESDYEKDLKPLIDELEQKGLAHESEGALIIELENLPPALIRKSDGATLYFTREIASLKDREENESAEKILYVVANEQALHFQQLFAVAKLLGLKAELVHVKFGMVLGEDGKKLATREGKVVFLQEVIDRVVDLAKEVVRQKNPELSDRDVQNIAQAVGIGALKYNDLRQHPYSDIVFDWKQMLDLSGNSGPYLQYTYARLQNIVRKAGGVVDADAELLVESDERSLMRHLLDFGYAIEKSAEEYATNGLALYLYELAGLASRYYESTRILDDTDQEKQKARVLLIATVAQTIKTGLSLLGIQTLDRI